MKWTRSPKQVEPRMDSSLTLILIDNKEEEYEEKEKGNEEYLLCSFGGMDMTGIYNDLTFIPFESIM